MSDLLKAAKKLNRKLAKLSFSDPVSHIYNPLDYAIKHYQDYIERYGQGKKEAIFIGMNPGPFGMAQTGIPFGDIPSARDFLKITPTKLKPPKNEHPKRPVEGFECKRVEVSGSRLWGTIAKQFKTPEAFFNRFFIDNYCPLVFMEGETGRNKTPDKLIAAERNPLFEACDEHLRDVVNILEPKTVIGIGAFAEKRAQIALEDYPTITVSRILHPSPANPKANKDWAGIVLKELKAMGIVFKPKK